MLHCYLCIEQCLWFSKPFHPAHSSQHANRTGGRTQPVLSKLGAALAASISMLAFCTPGSSYVLHLPWHYKVAGNITC